LQKWRQLVLVNCLPTCPETMQLLNWALVNSMWLSCYLDWKLPPHTYKTCKK
jgi:hypothetical protein